MSRFVPALLSALVGSGLMAAEPIRINFQPSGAAAVSGYLVDSGAAYASRGNGQSYGWSAANGSAQDRNSALSPDQRYDTSLALQPSTSQTLTWRIAVPSGVYQVRVVCGDAALTSGTVRLDAEGVRAVDGTLTSNRRWLDGLVTVPVTDGALNLTVGSGATSTATRLAFLDIIPVGDRTVTPTANINFQPTSAAIPAGYLPDSGAVYGSKAGGLSYGWTTAVTGAVDRNAAESPDQRHDTAIPVPAGNTWSIGVASGPYLVRAVAGDAGQTTGARYQLDVGGKRIIDQPATTAARWAHGATLVDATSDLLRVTGGPDASNNRLCFLDISSAVVTADHQRGPWRWVRKLYHPQVAAPASIGRDGAIEDAALLAGDATSGLASLFAWNGDNAAGGRNFGGNTLIGPSAANYWVSLESWTIQSGQDNAAGVFTYYPRFQQDARLVIGWSGADARTMPLEHGTGFEPGSVQAVPQVLLVLPFRYVAGGGTTWQTAYYKGNPTSAGLWLVPAGSNLVAAQADLANRLADLSGFLNEIPPEVATTAFRLQVNNAGTWQFSADINRDGVIDQDILSTQSGNKAAPAGIGQRSGLMVGHIASMGTSVGMVGRTTAAIRYQAAPAEAIATPRSQRPFTVTIPPRSRVSPALVTGQRWASTSVVEARASTLPSGKATPTYLTARDFTSPIPLLATGDALSVLFAQAGTPEMQRSGSIVWDVVDLAEAEPQSIHTGDSLLFTWQGNCGSGDPVSFDFDGDGVIDTNKLSYQLVPFKYTKPGVFTAVAKVAGVVAGTCQVRVAALTFPDRMLAVVNGERRVRINTGDVPTSQFSIAATDPTALTARLIGSGTRWVEFGLTPKRRGSIPIAVQLAGRVEAVGTVTAVSIERPTTALLLDDATHTGPRYIRIRPWVDDVALTLEMKAGTGSFTGNAKVLRASTNPVSASIARIVKTRLSGETEDIGVLTYGVAVPPLHSDFCHTATLSDTRAVPTTATVMALASAPMPAAVAAAAAAPTAPAETPPPPETPVFSTLINDPSSRVAVPYLTICPLEQKDLVITVEVDEEFPGSAWHYVKPYAAGVTDPEPLPTIVSSPEYLEKVNGDQSFTIEGRKIGVYDVWIGSDPATIFPARITVDMDWTIEAEDITKPLKKSDDGKPAIHDYTFTVKADCDEKHDADWKLASRSSQTFPLTFAPEKGTVSADKTGTQLATVITIAKVTEALCGKTSTIGITVDYEDDYNTLSTDKEVKLKVPKPAVTAKFEKSTYEICDRDASIVVNLLLENTSQEADASVSGPLTATAGTKKLTVSPATIDETLAPGEKKSVVCTISWTPFGNQGSYTVAGALKVWGGDAVNPKATLVVKPDACMTAPVITPTGKQSATSIGTVITPVTFTSTPTATDGEIGCMNHRVKDPVKTWSFTWYVDGVKMKLASGPNFTAWLCPVPGKTQRKVRVDITGLGSICSATASKEFIVVTPDVAIVPPDFLGGAGGSGDIVALNRTDYDRQKDTYTNVPTASQVQLWEKNKPADMALMTLHVGDASSGYTEQWSASLSGRSFESPLGGQSFHHFYVRRGRAYDAQLVYNNAASKKDSAGNPTLNPCYVLRFLPGVSTNPSATNPITHIGLDSLDDPMGLQGTFTYGGRGESGGWQELKSVIESSRAVLRLGRAQLHGAASANEAFPRYAETLMRRGGSLTDPVIKIVSGGTRALKNCSLYGSVSDKTNTWQLAAVAGNVNGAQRAAGYTIKWSNIPVSNATADAITVTLPVGRWQPRLTVYDDRGQFVSQAEIHDLVVEDRPTLTVNPTNALLPDSALFGVAHGVSRALTANFPVDYRLTTRLARDLANRRVRMSPDGYPQNEYWVGDADDADLFQVFPLTGIGKMVLQGYDLPAPFINETSVDLSMGLVQRPPAGKLFVTKAKADEHANKPPAQSWVGLSTATTTTIGMRYRTPEGYADAIKASNTTPVITIYPDSYYGSAFSISGNQVSLAIHATVMDPLSTMQATGKSLRNLTVYHHGERIGELTQESDVSAIAGTIFDEAGTGVLSYRGTVALPLYTDLEYRITLVTSENEIGNSGSLNFSFEITSGIIIATTAAKTTAAAPITTPAPIPGSNYILKSWSGGEPPDYAQAWHPFVMEIMCPSTYINEVKWMHGGHEMTPVLYNTGFGGPDGGRYFAAMHPQTGPNDYKLIYYASLDRGVSLLGSSARGLAARSAPVASSPPQASAPSVAAAIAPLDPNALSKSAMYIASLNQGRFEIKASHIIPYPNSTPKNLAGQLHVSSGSLPLQRNIAITLNGDEIYPLSKPFVTTAHILAQRNDPRHSILSNERSYRYVRLSYSKLSTDGNADDYPENIFPQGGANGDPNITLAQHEPKVDPEITPAAVDENQLLEEIGWRYVNEPNGNGWIWNNLEIGAHSIPPVWALPENPATGTTTGTGKKLAESFAEAIGENLTAIYGNPNDSKDGDPKRRAVFTALIIAGKTGQIAGFTPEEVRAIYALNLERIRFEEQRTNRDQAVTQGNFVRDQLTCFGYYDFLGGVDEYNRQQEAIYLKRLAEWHATGRETSIEFMPITADNIRRQTIEAISVLSQSINPLTYASMIFGGEGMVRPSEEELANTTWTGVAVGAGLLIVDRLQVGKISKLPWISGEQRVLRKATEAEKVKYLPKVEKFTPKQKMIKNVGKWCFPGETLILTPNGAARIDQLKIGDHVISRSENGGAPTVSIIDHIFSCENSQIIKIGYRDSSQQYREVKATAEHPLFNVDSQQWMSFGEVKVGDQVALLNGTSVITDVAAIAFNTPIRTYNLAVSRTHTYYVLAAGSLSDARFSALWVHNSNLKLCDEALKRVRADFDVWGKANPGKSPSQYFKNVDGKDLSDIPDWQKRMIVVDEKSLRLARPGKAEVQAILLSEESLENAVEIVTMPNKIRYVKTINGKQYAIDYIDGFPDFKPVLYKDPAGKTASQVRIKLHFPPGDKSSADDINAAWKKAGFTEGVPRPPDYTWHHNEELGLMQLVPKSLNSAAGGFTHTGGTSIYKTLISAGFTEVEIDAIMIARLGKPVP